MSSSDKDISTENVGGENNFVRLDIANALAEPTMREWQLSEALDRMARRIRKRDPIKAKILKEASENVILGFFDYDFMPRMQKMLKDQKQTDKMEVVASENRANTEQLSRKQKREQALVKIEEKKTTYTNVDDGRTHGLFVSEHQPITVNFDDLHVRVNGQLYRGIEYDYCRAIKIADSQNIGVDVMWLQALCDNCPHIGAAHALGTEPNTCALPFCTCAHFTNARIGILRPLQTSTGRRHRRGSTYERGQSCKTIGEEHDYENRNSYEKCTKCGSTRSLRRRST